MVKINTGNTAFKIYPNPVINQQINIHADEMAKGQYHVVLHNQQGQQIMQRIVNHPGGLFSKIIIPDALLAEGIYYLQIISETEKLNLKIFIK